MEKRMARGFLNAILLLALSGAVLGVGSLAAAAGLQVQASTVIDRARSAAAASAQTSSGRSTVSSPTPSPAAPAAAEAEEREKRIELVGRRDPFKLPPAPTPGRPGETVVGPLPPGIRGLIIGQLRLLGTVRLETTQMMLAVVTNYTNRAYFLRENDVVFNGVVGKITPDSVIFMENYPDPSGAVRSREVIKRLGSAPGEGR